MKIVAWLVITIVLGMGLFISGLFMGKSIPTGTFRGSEVFNTEEEYTQFKTALALTDWSLGGVNVLHSDPPILVEFRTHDSTHSFPYGIESTTKEGMLAISLFGLGLVGLGSFSIFVMATKEEQQ